MSLNIDRLNTLGHDCIDSSTELIPEKMKNYRDQTINHLHVVFRRSTLR